MLHFKRQNDEEQSVWNGSFLSLEVLSLEVLSFGALQVL